MTATDPIDEARLGLLLGELRLPGIKHICSRFAERADPLAQDREGWPAARFLVALAEHELAERERRRIERHLTEPRLPPGKTLDSFDFDAVPMVSKAQVMAPLSRWGRRRQLARKGRQPARVRPTRRRKEPSRRRHRPRAH